MSVPRLATLCGILLCVTQPTTAADYSGIVPTTNGSHLRFIEVFTNQTERGYGEIVAIYDDAIRNNPQSSQPLIEKCKFIEGAFPIGDDEGHRKQADLDSAVSLLAEAFPDDPEAVLYRSERLVGKEQIELLTRFAAPDLAAWNNQQRFRLLESLAWAYYFDDDLLEAKSRAQSATKLDPSRDLSLIVASYYDSIGREELAAQSLIKHLDSDTEPWKKHRKAQLLSKAGRPAEALRIYEALRAEKGFFISPLDYADVLQKAGRLDAARSELAKVTESAWQADSARRALFDLEVSHGNATAATKSYRSLCANGIQTDSLLRRRITLAVRYPGAPWTFTDFIRLALLGMVMVFLVVLPLVWIIPVHYIGLLRERKAGWKLSEDTLWHLGHSWWVSVVWLWANFLAIYCFQYDEFAKLLLDDQTREFVLNPQRLGPTALTFLAVFASGVLILQRKRHWLLAIKSRWGVLRTVLIAFAAVIFVRIAFRALRLLFDLANGSPPSAAGPTPGAVSDRVQMIIALGNDYGIGMLFMWLVVIAPLTEEFVFRGIILDSVRRHLPFHLANIGQALAFAAFHAELSHFLYFMLFGWVAGMMRRMSNGLGLPICFHVMNNAFAFVQIAGGVT
jgi:membrane protease YdiL (CAAX protease family)